MFNGIKTEIPVAKKRPDKKTDASDESEQLGGSRVEFQAPADWVERLERHAKALGMGKSAYIRMAVNRQMNLDDRAAESN